MRITDRLHGHTLPHTARIHTCTVAATTTGSMDGDSSEDNDKVVQSAEDRICAPDRRTILNIAEGQLLITETVSQQCASNAANCVWPVALPVATSVEGGINQQSGSSKLRQYSTGKQRGLHVRVGCVSTRVRSLRGGREY